MTARRQQGFAQQLPDPSAPTFAEQIRTLDLSVSDSLAMFMAVLADDTRSRSDRFAALYGALHRYRRESKFAEYTELCRRHEGEFGEEPYFDTFRVVIHSNSADARRGYRKAMEAAHRAVERLPDTPGVLHQQSETAANMFELDQVADPQELREALRNVNTAIRLTHGTNPQYYATRARLHLADDDTDNVRSDVGLALAKEDTTARDFARRVSRYESIRAMILIHERQQHFLRREQELRNELDSFRSQQLQLLGLLSAVIAFISTSAAIAGKATDLPTGFRLFLVAGGVIAVVFSSIAVSFGQRPTARLLPGLLVGASLILLGCYLPIPS